jgi:methionyl aminopeptidase
MNRIEYLKLASRIHDNIKKEIMLAHETNSIIINNNLREFRSLTITELRNYIQTKITCYSRKDEFNKGLGFPIGINCDSIVAHYTPISFSPSLYIPHSSLNPNYELGNFKLIKIDYGIQIDGYIIDKAFTLDMDKSELTLNLIKASEEAVDTIINNIGVDARLNELAKIGREIVESYEDEKGKPLKIVENVYSHTIAQWRVHDNKFIMPDTIQKDEPKVLDGEQYAIEIYASNGLGKGRLVDVPFVHSHFKLKDEFCENPVKLFDIDALNKMSDIIKTKFKTLPFCPNFIHMHRVKIDKKLPTHQKSINLCQQLQQLGVLDSYPPIIELDSSSIVSQIEKNVVCESQSTIIL